MQRLLTPAELGKLLGLSVQTIYNRRCEGLPLPPAVKLGRLLRFPESGVRAWLDALEPAQCVVEVAPKRRRGRPTKAEQVMRRMANP